MTPTTAHQVIIPAALQLVPPQMRSPRAEAMLIAIALQESDFRHRRQIHGPARSFWMFEAIGVAGVLMHNATRQHALGVCMAMGYAPDAAEIHDAIQHNDVLACAFARLLLWQVPQALPGRDDTEEAYRQYISVWRPGRETPARWNARYQTAWNLVSGERRDH